MLSLCEDREYVIYQINEEVTNKNRQTSYQGALCNLFISFASLALTPYRELSAPLRQALTASQTVCYIMPSRNTWNLERDNSNVS